VQFSEWLHGHRPLFNSFQPKNMRQGQLHKILDTRPPHGNIETMKVCFQNMALAGVALLTAALLSGCATPYKAAGYGGGYTETVVTPDVFKVSFAGNWHTPDQRAKDFALLRAAELVRVHGFNYFAVTEENDAADVFSTASPGVYVPETPDFNKNAATRTSSYTPTPKSTYTKPTISLVVHGYKTKPADISTLDATALEASLREKYHLR
jgi:hypothetical protein